MVGQLPLPALLSHALVAFTVEFDNGGEHRLSQRKTISRRKLTVLANPLTFQLIS